MKSIAHRSFICVFTSLCLVGCNKADSNSADTNDGADDIPQFIEQGTIWKMTKTGLFTTTVTEFFYGTNDLVDSVVTTEQPGGGERCGFSTDFQV